MWKIIIKDPVLTSKTSHRQNALLWKAGIDFLVIQHVAIGFEYTGTAAARKSFIYKNRTFFNSWQPQYNKFAMTAKVIY
ncbi:MAG: hypothetical protein K2W92_06875 [Alphaproteobacteria bacterium]|nr:hypothetical protein [Alphaproteobacteria bacterium]